MAQDLGEERDLGVSGPPKANTKFFAFNSFDAENILRNKRNEVFSFFCSCFNSDAYENVCVVCERKEIQSHSVGPDPRHVYHSVVRARFHSSAEHLLLSGMPFFCVPPTAGSSMPAIFSSIGIQSRDLK